LCKIGALKQGQQDDFKRMLQEQAVTVSLIVRINHKTHTFILKQFFSIQDSETLYLLNETRPEAGGMLL